MKLFVMCGVPASGKSTTSSIFARKTGFTLISRDKVRREIGETQYNKEAHARVREAFHNKIRSALLNGEDVIADATHLTKVSRKNLLDIAEEFNAEPHAIYLDDTWENIKERNSKRNEDERVPEEPLRNMYLDFQHPSVTEGFKGVHKVQLTRKEQ